MLSKGSYGKLSQVQVEVRSSSAGFDLASRVRFKSEEGSYLPQGTNEMGYDLRTIAVLRALFKIWASQARQLSAERSTGGVLQQLSSRCALVPCPVAPSYKNLAFDNEDEGFACVNPRGFTHELSPEGGVHAAGRLEGHVALLLRIGNGCRLQSSRAIPFARPAHRGRHLLLGHPATASQSGPARACPAICWRRLAGLLRKGVLLWF